MIHKMKPELTIYLAEEALKEKFSEKNVNLREVMEIQKDCQDSIPKLNKKVCKPVDFFLMKGVVMIMWDRIIIRIESVTIREIIACFLVVMFAAFSLGFCIGKSTEYSIQSKFENTYGLKKISDNYKLDLVYQMEVAGK